MAQCIRFACDNCSNDVEAWDDGNPYYFDRRGVKKYAYHPDPNFERCYAPAGDFPDVDISPKLIYTRFITAFGAGWQGVL